MSAPVSLAGPVRDFFEQHLVSQRGLSPHTVLGYRDTLKLLVQFAVQHHRKACTDLLVEDLSAGVVSDFLDHLQRVRHNSIRTRNVRLAAIHAFFRYLATLDPRHLLQCQSVLGVPFKRYDRRVPGYLDREEIQSIFGCLDGRGWRGVRDNAMLRLLYNTGMRAHELVSVDVNHVRFHRPPLVLIHGKGHKERTCPLWKETLAAIVAHLKVRRLANSAAVPLFVNGRGDRLSRFGLRYVIAHRVARTAEHCPSLVGRRVTPHTFRHTTAMHLLQAGVDLNMIRSWLGHASIETTHGYVEVDLDMKRRTLQATEHLLAKSTARNLHPEWQNNSDVLAWLSSL